MKKRTKKLLALALAVGLLPWPQAAEAAPLGAAAQGSGAAVQSTSAHIQESDAAAQESAAAQDTGAAVSGSERLASAAEGVYGPDSLPLTQVEELTTSSVKGENTVKIWTDSDGRYYYSVTSYGNTAIECSALGILTADADLSTGMTLDASSVKTVSGEEDYDILQGSSSHVNKKYNETSFALTKGNSRVTVIFRVFEDGMAYRYEVDGDTTSGTETTAVTGEASEFTLPDSATIWTAPVSQTYEGIEYTKRTMASQYQASAKYSTPILASLDSDCWALLSEASVYNEKDPYCASVFRTDSGKKSFQMTLGQYLVQETDESKDKSTYSASYAFLKEVEMQDVFHTPWRVAVLAPDLESLTNSSLIMDLNPDPAYDFSWVKPGASVWSWWSTSYDAIQYSTMLDYIDFAAETGMEYCLVDYGWELWDDFRNKIASLVEYADEKGVGLLLWYGVNKFDGKHIFDLDSADAIEEEFSWCESVGVKGVKVDYINSDSPFAMKVMYHLADLAAQYHLVLNYHGCTNPNGENRTYPNILSNEAVAGMENFKWNNGSSVPTLLALPYSRNVLGSMEFTPTAYRVSSSNATSGFMLATTVAYESAIQTFAHSAYVYPGYPGLSFLAGLPTTWDESRLVGGYPMESVIRARKKGENWYLGAMTAEAKTYDAPLDFLDPGVSYHAYIYQDNAAGDNIEITEQEVTSDMTLQLPLLANGGCAIKFTKDEPLTTTSYDNFSYYEAEDAAYATASGKAAVAADNYASNLKCVGFLGGDPANKLTFQNIPAIADGEYTLRVFFVSGEARDLYVRVNEDEPVKLAGLVGNANDWSAVGAVSIPVQLQEGDNEICFFNDSSYAPDIDRIAVSKLDLSAASINIADGPFSYNGTPIAPEASVTAGNKKLTLGQDYTISYENNTNAGTAKITARGINGCFGSVTKEFAIAGRNLSQCTATLPASAAYTGAAIQPQAAVRDGGATLVKGRDYKVTYRNNTNIGTASIVIEGIGNYAGTLTRTFAITAPVGKKFTVGAYDYKIASASAVSFAGLKNKKTAKVSIPKSVTIGGKSFQVTSIGSKALKGTKITRLTIGANVQSIGGSACSGCSKLTNVTIGAGVKTIQAGAFKNCKKLGTVTIKSSKLKTVGKQAFKGIKATAKIKVPAKKLKAYKKLLKNKGLGKKAKIVK